MVDIASSITRASAAAAKKSKGSNKDRVEDTGEAQGLAAPIDGEIVETQDVTDPGIAPVDKDAGEELLFEEAVESFDPKGKGSTSKEPDFIEFMKVVPSEYRQ
ncbi:hypothetical protein PtA15_4A545 [Puccinia triticina]|uniref:Uncharacterized protein n=1 Tax=Puccinia triticina TaxID=208348 RepID=A0ABY7CG69_9BASI|nr:uncharacterized protein PtA15_4A545 [Puccinia triticina]WAQ84094.1 hypothetical protein PtA15_4A545 [Puccinia triticina]